MKKQFWILALTLLIIPAVAADDETILTAFIGSWQAEGEAFGAPSTSKMQWANSELSGKFLKLDYQINRTTPNGPQGIFSGIAYYQKPSSPVPANHEIRAFWADTNGSLHPVLATIDGQALIAEWGTPDTEQGRTRYQMTERDTIQVTDWVKTPDGWRQFNHAVFHRTVTKP